MATKKSLAYWIGKGLRCANVRECVFTFIAKEPNENLAYACALGLALIGKYGNVEESIRVVENQKKDAQSRSSRFEFTYIALAAELLEIPMDLADSIDRRHTCGTPAQELAVDLLCEGFREHASADQK